MSFIRPAPPHLYTDAWTNQLATETNNNNVVAGRGVTLEKTTHGTTIHATRQTNPNALRYQGIYNFSSSYAVGDCIFVDPELTYYDQSGSVIPFTQASGSLVPPICAGAFVCTVPVPPANATDTELLGAIYPIFTASGQTVTDTLADSYRHYGTNVYWPVYPVPASYAVNYVSEGTWYTQASQSFWQPLCLASGSGGGVTQMAVISEQSSSLSCVYAYAAASGVTGSVITYSSSSVYVAKPPELRGFIATSTDSQGLGIKIVPAYTSGSLIYASQPSGGTGVTVSSSAVTWLDANDSGRQIGRGVSTCENVSGTIETKTRYFVCTEYS